MINGFVGAMVGLERTVLPLLAEDEFGMASRRAALSFIVTFGLVKAVTNSAAGHLADHLGRRQVLVLGWLFALPVPPMVILAPSWSWIIAANVLLGINQGLAWSTTVIMKIDLVGPSRRGLAMGLNEASGYLSVALAALASGYLAEAYGMRPEPFYLGIVVAALGLGLSLLFARETMGHVQEEARASAAPHDADRPGARRIFAEATWRHPALSSASQAGLVNNLNDGLAWGLFPIFFADHGLSVGRVGLLAAIYPAVWGVGQLYTGGLSDRIGRKPLIVTGMLTQAAAIGLIGATEGFAVWAAGAALLGAGTAMVYPTLLAAVSDVAHPSWRARSVGVYRLWRDAGFAVGALAAGVLADAVSIRAAIFAVGALTAASGVLVWLRMYETLRPRTR